MKKLTLLLACAALSFAQSYPSSIYVPPVAGDNVATTLSVAMAAGDTVAVVGSGTGWQAGMLAYICDGTQTGIAGKCSGTFEIMLVTNAAGNVLTVTRAQGGTSAVAHAKNKAISNAITSPYVNGPNAEVAAIETALGTNLQNVIVEASTSRYNFPAQTPSGSLSPGANFISFSPGVIGVSAANVGQYLYIQTAGTPEAVPIIAGGTCTGTDTTACTVKVTATFAHSHGYTVQSASSGGQEAVNASPAGSVVVFPPGATNLYAPIIVTRSAMTIQGAGPGTASTLVQNTASLGMIINTVNGFGLTVQDLTVGYNGTPGAGTVAILFQGTMAGDVYSPTVNRLQCANVATCIDLADAQYFSIQNVFSQSYSEYGVRSGKVYGSVDGGDSRIQDCTFGGGIASIFLDHTPVVIMTGNKYNGGDYGIHGVNSGGPIVTNSSFENHNVAGLLFEASGGTDLMLGGLIANNFIDQNFDVAWGGIILAPYGSNAIRNIQIKNNLIGGLPGRTHTQTGVFFGGSSTATDVSIEGDFAALTTAVNVSAGSTNISVTNYSLGTAGDAVTTPLVLSNTETTVRPNAPVTYAQMVALGAVRDGSQAYCSNCNASCSAGGSTGSACVRQNGAWGGVGGGGTNTALVYNVKDYGATGNGVTNDTVAVAAAVTAATATGGTVFFPRATGYLLSNVTVPASVTVEGSGRASPIIPASSLVIFQGADGAHGLAFRNLYFDYHGTAVNTATAISLLRNFHTTIDSVEMNDIGLGITIDQCFDVQISNVKMIDNTTLFVGSTKSGTGPYGYGRFTFGAQLVNIQHFTSIGLGSLSFARSAVVTFQRAVNSSLVDFVTQGLMNAADGVDILSDCQGVQVIGGIIVGATNGVNMQGAVVDGVNGNPSYSRVQGTQIDQYYSYGVWMGGSSFMNNLIGSSISGAQTTAQSGVLISGSSRGNSVQHGEFSAIPYGYGVIVQNTAFDAHVVDNYFELTSSAAAILVQGPTNPNVQVTGNRRSYLDTAPLYIVNGSTSTNVIIKDNAGIDDVVGADLASGTTITPTNPMHRVTGTGTITTIARTTSGAAAFTVPLVLMPTGAWQLATGVNIAAACTATAGKAITLFWNTTTSLWYPGGC